MAKEKPFYTKIKEHRESLNIDLNDVVKKTNINFNFLKAIEEGNFKFIPKEYVKLFLKSYSNQIGLDYKSVINDYEILTYGSIKTKPKHKTLDYIKKNEKNDPNSNNYLKKFNIYSILSISTSLILIYIFFTFISHLSSSIQVNDTKIEDLNPYIKNKKQEISKSSFKVPNFIESSFNKTNLIEIDNFILPITSPFIIDVKALNKSRIHYRTVSNQITKIDKNIVLDKDSILSIQYDETIFFDLLNCNDFELIINNFRIDNRIECSNSLLRASIDSKGAVNTSSFSY
tara:strand:- start:798 stop:1658 length:861 start_codon:yes stop_codon:yes gene_type:complete